MLISLSDIYEVIATQKAIIEKKNKIIVNQDIIIENQKKIISNNERIEANLNSIVELQQEKIKILESKINERK